MKFLVLLFVLIALAVLLVWLRDRRRSPGGGSGNPAGPDMQRGAADVIQRRNSDSGTF